MSCSSFLAATVSAMLLVVSLIHDAHAAPPTVSDVNIRGLQIGVPTTVTFSGSDLAPMPVITIPGVTLQESVVVPTEANSGKVAVSLQVDPQTRPGVYPMWVEAMPGGVSNPIAVAIDSLPQLEFREQIDSLPVALHGRLEGGTILSTKFNGKAGMRLVIEVESRRLGANLRPVVRLLNSRGTQIEFNQGLDRLSGDARCDVQLTEDGMYTVQLHDLLYRGAGPGYFRLKIGDLTYADMVFPLGIQRGQTALFQLLDSNLPTATTSVAAPADWLLRSMPVIPEATNYAGISPRIAVSDHPEMIEPSVTQAPFRLPAAPIGISGRLQKTGEEDRFVLPVTAGTTLRLNLFAERVGSPLDGVLMVRDDYGNELARADDQPGTTDPVLDYAVPQGIQQVNVAITDLLKRGGDDFIYRLQVRDLSRPDFNLTLDTDRLTIPAGATRVVRVTAQRTSGYQGPIALQWEGLPADVRVTGSQIAAGTDTALVALQGPPNGLTATYIRVLGQVEGDASTKVVALVPDTFRSETHPWIRQHLGLAVGEPTPVQVAFAATALESLPRGGKIALPFTITRASGAAGKVRVRLLTSQNQPKKQVNQGFVQQTVDDAERTLRLEADVLVDATANEGTAQLLIPADLTENTWSVVLIGELLGADDSTVAATSTTECRMVPVTNPVRVELASAPAIEAKAGLGESGKFVGKVIRPSDQPVTVTIVGLPADYPAPIVQVPAGQEDYELKVSFPYGLPAAELKNLQLVADMPATSGGNVRSSPVAVEVRVVPGEKPPAEQPLTIFEDDESLVAQLSKGNGLISLEKDAKYSGAASVKVTPDQRFNETLPMLGVRIRENPAPGEFRYLKFAWRKVGGSSVCLQVNHDGTWGPGGSGRQGAKFRYHAGPADEVLGGSIGVDKKLPAEFVVVTRDLFADFGEFTFTGLSLTPIDGEYALFDHIYLGRSVTDFELVAPK